MAELGKVLVSHVLKRRSGKKVESMVESGLSCLLKMDWRKSENLRVVKVYFIVEVGYFRVVSLVLFLAVDKNIHIHFPRNC